MLEKRKVYFPKPSVVTVKLGDQDVFVDPFLSNEQQRILLGVYFDNFSSGVLQAENALKLTLLDLATSVMLIEEDEDGVAQGLFTIDNVFANDAFYSEVINSISNYDEFRWILEDTVRQVQEERAIQASLGNVLSSLYEKAEALITELSNTNLSPESISGIRSLLAEANESSVLKTIAENFGTKNKG